MKKLLLLLPLLLLGCNTSQQVPMNQGSDSKHIQILERGIMNGYSYSILLHKPTGKKIFAMSYNGMIYLPEPQAEENTKTNTTP